jgi:nitric oxide dioxygenase
MLSDQSTQVIRDTLPAVGAAIGEITPLFYEKMFTAHPELIRDLFNRGNQAQGDQPLALAGSIAAYATILVSENAHPPEQLLARIAHKHASLGVTKEQYAIVHEHLFAAIVQVLGDAVTPEVAAAWDELYWHMADDLVAIEQGLYSEAGVEPGEVWRQVVVSGRQQESPDTVAFSLAAVDGSALPTARPGQYISVTVSLPDGANQIRQYSLTRGRADGWAISVKSVPATVSEAGTEIPEGEVSNFLHRNVFEGDELRVSLPFGDLVLDQGDDPLLLVSAGIGCTPIIGMLHYLTHTTTDRPVTVLHADRSPARQAHRRELAELVAALPGAALRHWYEDLGVRTATTATMQGLIELKNVEVLPETQAYLCGPLPFMDLVRSDLLKRGLPEANIHYEVFGPDKWLAGL